MPEIQVLMDGISNIVFGVVIVATVIVRLTPTKSDDRKLNAFLKRFHSVLAFFPTVGVNPQTRELKKKAEEQEVDDVSRKP